MDDYRDEASLVSNFQRHMCEQWSAKLEAARESRKSFDEIGKQCMAFFADNCGFMWKAPFYQQHLDGVEMPYFQVTINKVREFVDIYGPYLFWDYPWRQVSTRMPLELPPDIMQVLGNPSDPMMQMQLAAMQQDHQRRDVISKVRAALLERWLNYTPQEQQEDLVKEGAFALQEAMTRGRGCLWTETYSHPGSTRRLTGSFYGSVMDLLIDPDCCDPALKTATWIARERRNTTWELERKWKLPEGTLKEYAVLETADSKLSNRSADQQRLRAQGKTHDIVIWYEIYTRCGIGTRLQGAQSSQHEVWDNLLGDFVYLAIAHGVPWFLNAPPPHIYDESDEEVANRFAWPCPLLTIDSRWPCQILDFNPLERSAWPMPPVASAMGELICLNILVAAALENAYENRKQVVAYLKSEAKQVEEKLRKSNKGTIFFEVTAQLNKSVSDIIQYINRPGMNNDIWSAIEYVSMLFDKRTGLTEFMYAGGQSQSRSARDIAAKEEKSSIRPDKMARDVAAWQTKVARAELLAAAGEITGQDVLPLMGPLGAQLWDAFITNADPEEICREMSTTVEASNIRKPNKERETENIQNMMGWLLPVLQQVAMTRGDEEGVRGLNAFIRAIGKALDQDTSDWMVPPFSPPPNEIQTQLQQLLAQTEVDKGQAEAESKRADAHKKLAEAAATAREAETEGAERAQELADDHVSRQQQFDFDQIQHLVKLNQDQEKHQQQMRQNAAQFIQRSMQLRQEADLKRRMKAAANGKP